MTLCSVDSGVGVTRLHPVISSGVAPRLFMLAVLFAVPSSLCFSSEGVKNITSKFPSALIGIRLPTATLFHPAPTIIFVSWCIPGIEIISW